MAERVLPAEWAPQTAVLLTWPHEDSDWAFILPQAETTFTAIVQAITTQQTALVVCQHAAHRARLAEQLAQAGVPAERLQLVMAPAEDTWARDHGPLTVLDQGQPLLLDFIFNGWGNKYPALKDNLITQRLHAQGVFADTRLESIPLVLEGGSLESDGLGTLLTTESCLLSPERNPAYGREQIEAALQQHLGAQRVLWLRHGHLHGDDTDGHIDTLARFCTPDTIAYVCCEDPEDPHYDDLQAMQAELGALRQANGQAYRLIALPLPRAQYNAEGKRLPATHANFLIINGAVLVPTYNDPTDAIACQRLAEVFPGRQIIGIDCRALIEQYGSLHCVTMQLPAPLPLSQADRPSSMT
ncbi:agmatine deiminase family protein [Thiorhodospira sibirica]|uniref:agmatine deiminase family protein n=1 Tax=Thiorhodospira sibirica TaxID=154347 RepID=UPI00022C0B64|nr:agmatine deiminase family protein [Thiorhodospira sibirica]